MPATDRPGGIIDTWAQLPTERFMEVSWLEPLMRWTGMKPVAPEIGHLVSSMDSAGVDLALLSAWSTPEGMLISNDEVAAAVEAHPDRLRGVGSVDLRDPVGAAREVRRCVEDLGFVAIRVLPWVWNMPPDSAAYYPVYVACVETGVPFCTQIGHTGPLCPSEPGRLIPYLDRVLLDFPELVVVGGHVGFPWIDEVISLATKYPNFYVDTSAYALHRLPRDLVTYMAGRGRDRVIFGTNWPMLDAGRCLDRIGELGLDEETTNLFLRGNAERVYGLG